MLKQRVMNSVGVAVLLTTVLTACGGGGGGTGAGGASNSNNTGNTNTNPDGSWLTFTPALSEVVVFPGTTANFSITATSSKVITEQWNVAVIDKAGVVDPAITLQRSGNPLVNSVLFKTKTGLAAGTYSGTFELKLCYDDPSICARPISGSPWQIPYKITVLAQSDLHYKYWTTNNNLPFAQGLGLGLIGTRLIVPAAAYAGTNSYASETWASSDNGDTWERLSVGGPAVATSAYGLASDGTALYVSGGRDMSTAGNPYTNSVWKFNGTQWQMKTSAAEFSPRARQVMLKFGSDLYVMGGLKDDQALNDVWKSSDDGAHWRQLPALPPALGRPTCAVSWRGSMVVIGDTVMTSSDGQSWSERKVSSSGFPFKSMQCAVLNDRLFINATDGYNGLTYSTTDLQTWQLDAPRYAGPFDVPGMVALNGSLIVLSGEGTSQRTLYRTLP